MREHIQSYTPEVAEGAPEALGKLAAAGATLYLVTQVADDETELGIRALLESWRPAGGVDPRAPRHAYPRRDSFGSAVTAVTAAKP